MQSRWAATERRGGSDSEDSDRLDSQFQLTDFSEPHFEP